jgi:hypothetical protein
MRTYVKYNKTKGLPGQGKRIITLSIRGKVEAMESLENAYDLSPPHETFEHEQIMYLMPSRKFHKSLRCFALGSHSRIAKNSAVQC